MKIFKRNINLGRKVPVIDTPDLRDKCVTTDKLADGSVTTNKIADGAITREKIADKAITNLDNVVQQAQETADHPTYVGEDNYVYAWNRITKTYDKTSNYVRGEGFHVSKTFDSVADMEAYTGTDLKEGDFVLIQSTPDDPDNAKLYTFSGTQGVYNYLINMSGALGFTGQTPQFSIGSIITIEPTEQASASLSPDGTDSDGNPKYKLNLALPKGEKGTSDFVIVDDHSGAGDDPNKIYIPSANAEKENATAIANEVSRATEAEQTNATAIATEEARARAAELENATAIADEVTRAKAAEQANVTAIGGIEEKIPTQATAQNKLADKDFVNSSISTATADFKGTYNSLADLQAVVGANANDYGFVVTTDAAGNTVYKKYKYVTGTGWAFEYVLNNSSFTAEQWATIQSGMTAALTSKLADLPTNTALQDALTTIRESVATEGTRARAAEKANATAITDEVTRATEAEQTNATAIAAEEARARAAEQTNATAIAAEETRARAAEADRYTKSETYTKTEINGLVDTPHQEYVTVDAYSNLPATGSKDTIYRVSNYNGSTSQVDASAYSEYAWNGSQYVFLCVKAQIEEVFDISVYNNNTKYADLVAALNGGANIPQSLQKGGMSVKFVQSSDNKYVQSRYMSTSTAVADFTNEANWQGVDDEPTAGSDNLVKSGGVNKTVMSLGRFRIMDYSNQGFLYTIKDKAMWVIEDWNVVKYSKFIISPNSGYLITAKSTNNYPTGQTLTPIFQNIWYSESLDLSICTNKYVIISAKKSDNSNFTIEDLPLILTTDIEIEKNTYDGVVLVSKETNGGFEMNCPFKLTNGYWGVSGITSSPGYYCIDTLIEVSQGCLVIADRFFKDNESETNAAAYLYDKNGNAIGNRINIQDFTVVNNRYIYTVSTEEAAYIGLSTRRTGTIGYVSVKYPYVHKSWANAVFSASKHVDLIMFMGQSNMAGRGLVNSSHPETAPVVLDGAGYEFRAISDPTTLYPITEPFGVAENNPNGINDGSDKTGSMVSAFVNAYHQTTGKVIVGVSASVGGANSSQWLPTGTLLPDAIQRLNATKSFLNEHGYIIDHIYMAWCQGESDGDRQLSIADYKSNFRLILNAMKSEGVEVCFIVRIGQLNVGDSTKYSDIITAQTELCKENDDCIMVSTAFSSFKEKGLMKDQFHYYQEGYNIVGTYAGRNAGLFRMYGVEKIQYDSMHEVDANIPELYISDKCY